MTGLVRSARAIKTAVGKIVPVVSHPFKQRRVTRSRDYLREAVVYQMVQHRMAAREVLELNTYRFDFGYYMGPAHCMWHGALFEDAREAAQAPSLSLTAGFWRVEAIPHGPRGPVDIIDLTGDDDDFPVEGVD